MGLLDGQVAVVTGSGACVGEGVDKTFSKHGARIVVNSSAFVDAGRELPDSLPDASYVPGDVSREDGAKQVVDAGLDLWGRIDIVVTMRADLERSPMRTSPPWTTQPGRECSTLSCSLRGT
jgi:NAD(P)-dependent dehydrogenase (short-subunit alcohol dehydrogenase family)